MAQSKHIYEKTKTCSRCGDQAWARDLCNRHYLQWYWREGGKQEIELDGPRKSAPGKRCMICGGPVGPNNTISGICVMTAACRKASSRRWQVDNYARYLLIQARRRSLRDGVPFSIKASDLPDVPSECPCCGRAIKPKAGTRDDIPMLDRVITPLGYVPGNVKWLCGRCNVLKSNASGAELMRLAQFVLEREKEARAALGEEEIAC